MCCAKVFDTGRNCHLAGVDRGPVPT